MIIGLNGRMRAGKDAFCSLLQELDSSIERISFADKMKQSAAAALGISIEKLERLKSLEEWEYAPFCARPIEDEEYIFLRPSSFTIRLFLQRYGTEAHRDIFGEDFWVNAALPEEHEGRILVVTDCRFPNEAQAILDRGGIMVRILRPSSDERPITHPSEQTLEDNLITVELDNDGTIEDLREKAEAFLGMLEGELSVSRL